MAFNVEDIQSEIFLIPVKTHLYANPGENS